ncbi:hypothetical protein BU15DRAFT_81381 [Melanogaster broomeanus]|nr:hypothetical protein BU15DRAFT_81381 [Melanogaster broomeanus]
MLSAWRIAFLVIAALIATLNHIVFTLSFVFGLSLTAEELAKTFTWTPPLAAESDEDYLAGPESITDEELAEAFEQVDYENNSPSGTQVIDPDLNLLDENEVLEGRVYSWAELELVDKGTKPTGFEEDITIIDKSAALGSTTWNIQDLLSSEGVY